MPTQKPDLTKIEKYVIEVLKEKRLELGISQREHAYELDMSPGFIGDVENPKPRAKYNRNHLNKMAKIFKCFPQDFLPGKPL